MAEKITFDEEKYNRLIKMLDLMETTLLHSATETESIFLDADFVLQPGTQKWKPAIDLVTKGQGFGGSVAQQNELLRQAIVKFRNALVAAKGVFKDTTDLATYDVGRFVAEFPDFNAGGGLTGSPTPPPK